MPTKSVNFAISCAAGIGAAAVMQLSSPAFAQAQACATQRPNIMLCGSSTRTGANLYSGAGPYTQVSGCTPDASTQALLVTRSGSTAGNGAAWLAYLNAGGNIITEYSKGAAVYNEIYGTAYAQGNGFGQCYDNPMPQVKLNTSNAFWLANNLAVTPAAFGACGFSLANVVAGEPSVTALGAATGGVDISFAVRLQGGGRLNLVEADWQDSDNQYTTDSAAFMGALISGCGSAAAVVAPIPVNATWLVAGLASLLALFGMSFAGRRRA